MKSLVLQIGAGLVLVMCGIVIGMQIGPEKVVVVRAPDAGAPVVRAHQTAAQLLQRPAPRSRVVRQARPRIPPGREVVSPAEMRLEAVSLAKRWIDEVLAEDDEFRREKGLDAIRRALAKGNEVEILAGLHAFLGSADAEFDKAPFRALIEPHLSSGDGWTRRQAWYALFSAGSSEGDLERVRALASDPAREVRQSASHLISVYEGGDLTGESGEVVLGMLDDEDAAMRREILRGMWGARLSPDLEARVIELSRSEDHEQSHDAIYFALSTQVEKSADSVIRLIEVLGDPDWNNSGRAAWGLRQGVPPEAEPLVADAALRMMQEDAMGRSWQYGLELLKLYAGPDHLEAIEALAAREGLPEPLLKELAEVELEAARGQ